MYKPFQDFQPSYADQRKILESSDVDILQQDVQMLGLVQNVHPSHPGANNLHLI